MDTIHIRQLRLACILGVEPGEREHKQDVIVSVRLHGDFGEAARADCLEKAVDYAAIRDRITAMAEHSRYHLIEALAQAVADLCLADPRIVAVDVAVEKPGALAGRGNVEVEIHRARAAKAKG